MHHHHHVGDEFIMERVALSLDSLMIHVKVRVALLIDVGKESGVILEGVEEEVLVEELAGEIGRDGFGFGGELEGTEEDAA